MFQTIDNQVIWLYGPKVSVTDTRSGKAAVHEAGAVENQHVYPCDTVAPAAEGRRAGGAIARDLQAGNDVMAMLETAEAAAVEIRHIVESLDIGRGALNDSDQWKEIAEEIDSIVADSTYLDQNMLNADGALSKRIAMETPGVSAISDPLQAAFPECSDGAVLTVAVSDHVGVVRTAEFQTDETSRVVDVVDWLNRVFGQQMGAGWESDNGIVAEDVKEGDSALDIKVFKELDKITGFHTVREGASGEVALPLESVGMSYSFATADLTAEGLGVSGADADSFSGENKDGAMEKIESTIAALLESRERLGASLMEVTDLITTENGKITSVSDYRTAMGKLRFERNRTVAETAMTGRECYKAIDAQRAMALLSGSRGAGLA
jgi:hypothetical protein